MLPDRKLRIGIVAPHAAPYRDAVFTELAASSGIELKVFYLFANDVGHAYWKLNAPVYQFSVAAPGLRLGRSCYWHRHVARNIVRECCDVHVVSGLNHIAYVQTMLWSRLRGVPYVICADTVRSEETKRRLWRGVTRKMAARAAGVWVPGAAATAHFGDFCERDGIVQGCYTLDERVIDVGTSALTTERERIRKQWGAQSGDVVFLMVGNLLPKRRYDFLAACFAAAFAGKQNVRLVVVGEEPAGADYVRQAREQLGEKFVHVGPQSYAALAGLYVGADFYVHSGAEPYSTAIQYGAIVGCPIISSPAVGASWDYLCDQENGFLVGDGSATEWIAALQRAAALPPETRAAMGFASRRIARRRGVNWATRQIEDLMRRRKHAHRN